MIIALGYALDPSVASGDTSGERSVCVVIMQLKSSVEKRPK